MYKIIGADQKEYGPCSADELRQWLREGRANAQTLVQAAGTTEWKPLASFPELFAPLPLGTPPPFPTAPVAPNSVPVPEAEILSRDYDLDIGSCIGRAWKLLTGHFWPIVGISLLVLVANTVVDDTIQAFCYPSMLPQIEQILQNNSNPSFNEFTSSSFSAGSSWGMAAAWLLGAPLKTLLLGGLFRYYLKLIRGQTGDVGDAFSGFSLALVPLLLLGLVKSFLTGIALCFCLLPGIYLAVAWSFSVALVIDRRMDFWPAMELSRKVVSRHWFVILGLILLNSLVACIGFFACCIGLFISLPLAYMSMMYAYEDIFGRRAGGQT